MNGFSHARTKATTNLRQRLMVAGAVYAVIAACSVTALAADSNTDASRAATNQPLVLEEAVVQASDPAEEPPAREPASNAGTGDTAATAVGPVATDTPLVAPRASGAARATLTDRETPWYRSGMGALGVVLALVFAVAVVVRRWVPGARPADSCVIRIAARAALSPKQYVALVQLPRRVVLVGVTNDRIEPLCCVTGPDEVLDLLARVGGTASAGKFDQLLASEARVYREERIEESVAAPQSAKSATPKPGDCWNSLLKKLQALQPADTRAAG